MLIDNTGAIYLIKNHAVSQRTKHISIKWHFYREHHAQSDFDPIYHPTEENASDILTKNTDVKTFQKHDDAIRNCRTYLRMNWFQILNKCCPTVTFNFKENNNHK